MNTVIGSAILLALSAVTASAQQPGECASNVTLEQVIAAMGPSINVQPVYSPEGLRGWRLYWSAPKERIESQGIKVGSLMTHVCGVHARDVNASGGSVNCNAGRSCQIEVTFQIDGAEQKVVLKRSSVTATS